ncbi:MaoC/PaaZ C-terminal domain-containing protein [Bacillus sp. JJ722]|uniref:MaoC/PaaZ C-terminal domain-containing protein n=1 Tax=Bacillus sp. JJ722 TaxID=3122973 RepID=UPI0030003D5A
MITFTLEEKLIEKYALISGDNNPIHLDEKAAQVHGFSTKVAHGMLSMAKVWSIISEVFLKPNNIPFQYNLVFSSPVYVGEEITLKVEQTENEYKIEGKCKNRIVFKGNILLQSTL